MMFSIANGTKVFYQWDIGQKIIVHADCHEVHCTNDGVKSLPSKVYEENGQKLARIDDVFFQEAKPITVYGYVIGDDEEYTLLQHTFQVRNKPKPDTYAYTPTETQTWAALDKRVTVLEENGVSEEQIASAVEDYMKEHPIDPDSSQNVNPVPKTDDMTQPVGIDADGRLWVAPIGGGSGGGTDEPDTPGVTTHGIVWDLVNVSSSNAGASVNDGASLTAVLTPVSGYTLGDVTVTMGGEVLTGVWNADTATVYIAAVTGDVVISCAGVAQTGPVDTSPVIVQENMGLTNLIPENQITGAVEGFGITKIYEFTPDIDALKASTYYDSENDYLTTAINGCIKLLAPSTEMQAAGLTPNTNWNKAHWYRDGSTISMSSNGGMKTGATASITPLKQNTDGMYVNGIAFTLTLLDAENSYAYWFRPNANTIFPIGVCEGDIIFAGKNTEYYGMANIDGTMLGGETVAAELSYDDDVMQSYAVASVSVLGEETESDTNTAYGISSNLAAVIDEVRTAWMTDYGGDPRKIPLIITTDQHGRTNAGIFNMLGKTLSMPDVSKICNLGDTCAVEWKDSAEVPLLSCAALENWCESIRKIPLSKRLDVYGNHDAWYYDGYSVEGNAIGTRYPATMHHLDQYFRNIYMRRNNNHGWGVVRDDYFNVKYLIVTGFEFKNGMSNARISTAQMKYIIDELGKDDGYDIVVMSHMPLYYQESTATYPTGMTPEDTGGTGVTRFSGIDTDVLFNARKNKTSGTITDSDGVAHSFDFSDCTTEILCGLNGHMHLDACNHIGGNGLANMTFDWFDGNTVHFVLVDRVNNRLNVWKLEGDALTYQNYQIPLDKPT